MTSTPKHRYVDTPSGQMHMTEAGSGPAIVMLHWVPLSGRLYEAELSACAERGFRGVAVDLMGFGRSSSCDSSWTFSRHAEAVKAGLAAANIGELAVLGGHFSAPVAVEIAADTEIETTGLMLDGCVHFLPPAAIESIAAKTGKLTGPGLHADGSHRTFLWDQAINALEIFDPNFALNESTLPLVYRFMLDYLSTGPRAQFGGFEPYPLADRLDEVDAPILVLSAETDPLRPALEPTLAAAGERGRGLVLPGGHPLHDPQRCGEFANALCDFLEQT